MRETVVPGRLQPCRGEQAYVEEHTAALPSPDVRLMLGVRKRIAHSLTHVSKAES